MGKHRIKTFFTPGKEIENLFLDEDILLQMVPQDKRQEFEIFLEKMFTDEYDDCLGSFIKLHEDFLQDKKMDIKTIFTEYKPIFDSDWNLRGQRLSVINGKKTLADIRRFFADKCNMRLSNDFLLDMLINSGKRETLRKLVANIYQINLNDMKSDIRTPKYQYLRPGLIQ